MVMVLLTSGILNSQTPSAAQDAVQLRPGAEFPVEVRHTVKAANAHAGEQVEFSTLEAVLAGPNLVIPANAKIIGHVVEARRKADRQESLLQITIDEVHWNQKFARLRAVISGIGRRRIQLGYSHTVTQPTFLEGTTVVVNFQPVAVTTIESDEKDVVLRGGTILVLKNLSEEAESLRSER